MFRRVVSSDVGGGIKLARLPHVIQKAMDANGLDMPTLRGKASFLTGGIGQADDTEIQRCLWISTSTTSSQ